MLYGFFSPTAARQIRPFIYLTKDGREVEVTKVLSTKLSSSVWGDEAPVGELDRYLRLGSQPLPPIEPTEGASGSTWREAEPDPARALLAEMVDAFDKVYNSHVYALSSELTAGRRDLLDEAWEVSIKARDLLGVPWPRDCVRPTPDPTTTPSQE
jgi:hypothetical protein